MELQWLGKDSCLIKSGTVKIAVNPRKEYAQPSADMLITTIDEPELFHDAGNAFLCNWPGEYEIKDTLITGVEAEEPERMRIRTMYNIHLPEDLSLGLMLDITKVITPQQSEKLGNIDVLIIQSGGDGLNPKHAHEIIERVEPKAVILLSTDEAAKEELKKLLGGATEETVDTIKIQSSSLPHEGIAIYIPSLTA